MAEKRFSDTLRRAVNGEHDAVNAILEQYMPLVNTYSFIDGKFDEDCRQYILERIVKQLPKFELRDKK